MGARKERERGDTKVNVGYKKIYLREKWYRWNKKEKKLEDEEERKRK